MIGESSGRGEPYNPWLSVADIVAWRLEKVFPGRKIEVDMWATGGATLAVMHNKLAALSYRPDALVVYVGHNEFQSRYAWMRDVDYYRDRDRGPPLPVPSILERANAQRFSPFCRLVMETKERQRLDVMPPLEVTRRVVDGPACTAAEATVIFADFGRRLEEIASYCERIGTLPIFIIPASNDGGFDPSRSILAPETSRRERDAFALAVAAARDVEDTDPVEAVRRNRELIASHPEFAEAHFRLARLLERTACWTEARDHYIEARELDAMPLRCPGVLRQAYRDVSARHPAVLLVDGPKVLEAKSLHGIVDDHFFHDAQHPNLHGYAALAEDLINQLGARRSLRLAGGDTDPGRRARGMRDSLRPERGTMGRGLSPRGSVLRSRRLHSLRPQVPQRAEGRLSAGQRRDRGRAQPVSSPDSGLEHAAGTLNLSPFAQQQRYSSGQ